MLQRARNFLTIGGQTAGNGVRKTCIKVRNGLEKAVSLRSERKKFAKRFDERRDIFLAKFDAFCKIMRQFARLFEMMKKIQTLLDKSIERSFARRVVPMGGGPWWDDSAAWKTSSRKEELPRCHSTELERALQFRLVLFWSVFAPALI